jgi:hypothetical protein
MGRGKTSAAIQYMNSRKENKQFLYITPYLTEVERICMACGFVQPTDLKSSKTDSLKNLVCRGKSIAATHALFFLMSNDILDALADQEYCLIIDESIPSIRTVPTFQDDRDVIIRYMASVDEDYLVSWNNLEYHGLLEDYKKMAMSGNLYYYSNMFYEIANPFLLQSFKEIFILTYMFEGQLFKAYLDYFGFDYNVVGVIKDGDEYYFSDCPDNRPALDFAHLIRFHGYGSKNNSKINAIGTERGHHERPLSHSWFVRRGSKDSEIRRLNSNLHAFFKAKKVADNLWTTYKDVSDWFMGDNNRRASSFLPLNIRSINARRESTNVAYLVNRFVSPPIAHFFSSKGIAIDSDKLALSEMVQFIWRSAIREGREINLYMPSQRMRELLTQWIDDLRCKAA